MNHFRSSYSYFEEHFKDNNVYHLITFLCENLCDCSESGRKSVASYRLIQECRIRAYEVLLKKRMPKFVASDIEDPVDELEKFYFNINLNANTIDSKWRSTGINDCIQEILSEQFIQFGDNAAILKFLLHLKDTNSLSQQSYPLAPSFINYPIVEIKKLPYPIFTSVMFSMPIWLNLYDEKTVGRYDNPYLGVFRKFKTSHSTDFNVPTQFFTDMFELCSQKYNAISQKEPVEAITMDVFTKSLDLSIASMKPVTFLKQVPQKRGCKSPVVEYLEQQMSLHAVKSEVCPEIEPVPVQKYCKVLYKHNWENLGDKEYHLEAPFVTETNSIHYVAGVTLKSRQSLQVIPYATFIYDVKQLCIGLTSDSFPLNGRNEFTFKADLAVSRISQHCLSALVTEFIEVGTNFKYLNSLTTENPNNQKFKFDGFIFRVLSKCLQKFLFLFRKFVTSHVDNSLLKFSKRIFVFRIQIMAITRIIKHHLNETVDGKFWNGSIFIKYLFEQMSNEFDKNNRMFLIHILKHCCDAYYNKYEQWIFYGRMDDPHKELFIQFKDCYQANTKQFFDKAFYICEDILPSFLRGYENDILLCGKYTMLLKSFKPTHPLFSIKPPHLRIALSYDALNDLRNSCNTYLKKGLMVCGKQVSVRDVFQESKRQYDLFLQSINRKPTLKIDLIEDVPKYLQSFDVVDERMNVEKNHPEMLQSCEINFDQSIINKQISNIHIRQENDATITVKQDVEIKNISQEETLVKYHAEIDVALVEEGQSLNSAALDGWMDNIKRESSAGGGDFGGSQLLAAVSANNAELQNNKIHSESSSVFEKEGMSAPSRATGRPMSQLAKNRLRNMSHSSGMVRSDIVAKENMAGNRSRLTHLQYSYCNIKSRRKPSVATTTAAAPQNVIDDDDDDDDGDKAATKTKLSKNEKFMHLEYGFCDVYSMNNKQGPDDTAAFAMDSAVPTPTPAAGETLINKPVVVVDNSIMNDEINSNDTFTNLSYKNDAIYIDYWKTLEEYRKLTDANLKPEKCDIISNDLINLDMPSFTRFLQLSLSHPLKTHMELVNGEIMKLFIEELDMLGHIKCLRQYFFHMNGEFGNLLSDELFRQLRTNVQPHELLQMNSLRLALENAVESSKIGIHKYSHHLCFNVDYIPRKFNYKSPDVLDMLSLTYYIDWPLNLLITPDQLVMYDLVFNYLMKLKRLSWLLEELFQFLKDLAATHGRVALTSPDYRHVQHVRHKFSTFIYALQSHITWSALHGSWKLFEDNIQKAKTMDDLFRIHRNYIDRIITLCMLNEISTKFYGAVEFILTLAISFCLKVKSDLWVRKNGCIVHSKLDELKVIERTFDNHVKYIIFLGNSNYRKEIGGLIHLLNINSYYSTPIQLE